MGHYIPTQGRDAALALELFAILVQTKGNNRFHQPGNLCMQECFSWFQAQTTFAPEIPGEPARGQHPARSQEGQFCQLCSEGANSPMAPRWPYAGSRAGHMGCVFLLKMGQKCTLFALHIFFFLSLIEQLMVLLKKGFKSQTSIFLKCEGSAAFLSKHGSSKGTWRLELTSCFFRK